MVIGGDIAIRSVTGAGAMGRVYRAHQREIDRDVAVKILHRELSGNLPLVQRFHREAKIASKLQHPHVVEVYLAGQLPDGALYIAMEFLDGMSLAAATQEAGGSLPIERAIAIMLQICDAVGEGHARGIVHRDLKPENVMLVRRADTSDWVKVLDFGIAKVSLGEQSMQTAAGLIFGTARYISPEGAQGATVGPQGDVYSLAVMMYQLLAGRTPFDAEQAVGLLVKHIHDAPPRLRSWPEAAKVPLSLERVVMENLAKEPKQRCASARAFGNAIAAAAREANIAFADVGVVARMSARELPAAGKKGVEPTLDDREAPPTETPPTKPQQVRTEPLAEPIRPLDVALAATTADAAVPREISTRPTLVTSNTTGTGAGESASGIDRPADSSRPAKRGASFAIALAFMLGVALTALVMQYLGNRPDTERREVVTHARNALARGNYVDPPGDNVRDLVKEGLQRWPDDSDLLKTQSDAAHELVTRAMAARSGGDVIGARDLAKTAHDLDSTDGSAKLLLAQYEDEIVSAADDGGGGLLAGPRVTLDVPTGGSRGGARVELVARVFMGISRRNITGAQFVISGPGLPADGVTVPATGTGPFRGTFTPAGAGSYEVDFEANVDGASVRAERTLSVR
jgi:serine/threonine-protein kinase